MDAGRPGATGLLLVEDDLELAAILRQLLGELQCEIAHADTLRSARWQLGRRRWHLVLLDSRLPDGDGFELCRELRAAESATAIMMLTARSSESDRICALEIGADDYVSKPFSRRELLLRARGLLRRSATVEAQADAPVIRRGELVVDVPQRRAYCRGAELALTPREFELLAYMVRRSDRAFTRAQLLDAVWGAGFEGLEHTVNSHINRLRAKIELDPANPRLLTTVWGYGYRLVGTSEPS
jgi:two-component system OmpR family response regulator